MFKNNNYERKATGILLPAAFPMLWAELSYALEKSNAEFLIKIFIKNTVHDRLLQQKRLIH